MHGQRPRPDRVQQGAGPARSQDKATPVGRLFKQLEQGVGRLGARLLRHQVLGVPDHEALFVPHGGPLMGATPHRQHGGQVDALHLCVADRPQGALPELRQLLVPGGLQRVRQLAGTGSALGARQREVPVDVRMFQTKRHPAALALVAGRRLARAQAGPGQPKGQGLLAAPGAAVHQQGGGQDAVRQRPPERCAKGPVSSKGGRSSGGLAGHLEAPRLDDELEGSVRPKGLSIPRQPSIDRRASRLPRRSGFVESSAAMGSSRSLAMRSGTVLMV